MAILFMSDIHGVPDGLRRLRDDVLPMFNPRHLVILGDVLYHGPRNGVMPTYDTQAVADILNGWKEQIIAVRGNCDSDVDQMMLHFPIMSRYSTLLAGDRKFFLTHGHVWNPHNPPPLGSCDVLVYGHTHVPVLARDDSGLVLFNPGSISIPKNGLPPTFGLLDDGGRLTLRYLDTPDDFISELPLSS